jgi:hypothetical protein
MLSLIRTLCFSLQHMLSLKYLRPPLPSNGSQQCPLLFTSLPAGDCLTTNSTVDSKLAHDGYSLS